MAIDEVELVAEAHRLRQVLGSLLVVGTVVLWLLCRQWVHSNRQRQPSASLSVLTFFFPLSPMRAICAIEAAMPYSAAAREAPTKFSSAAAASPSPSRCREPQP